MGSLSAGSGVPGGAELRGAGREARRAGLEENELA